MAINETNKDSMILEYYVPIEESAEIDGDFTIKGIAINETTTSNGHKFIGEELSKSAGTLVGVPLLKDHDNSVDAIVGRVKSAYFDESMRSVPFKAVVKDTKMKQMIKDGLINSVSVGAHVNPSDIEESEDGSIIPHNITFKELSLVAVPADSRATFSVALNNAWSGHKSHSLSEQTNRAERGIKQEIMAEEKVTQLTESPIEVKEAIVEAKAEIVEKVEKVEEKTEKVEEKTIVEESVEVKALKEELAKMQAELKTIKESEAEVKPVEPEKAEVEDEEVEEKADYKIVAGHNSFTIVRENYRQRLVA